MPSKSYAVAFLVAAGVALAGPPAASAQTLPAGVNVSTEFGGRTFTQDLNKQQLGKFTEYKSMPSGAVLRSFLLTYAPADSMRFYSLVARNVGQIDQSLSAQARQPGLFDFQFQWDRIPHTFSTTARILGSRPTPDYFSLAGAPRADTGAINTTLNNLPASAFLGPVRTHWSPLKFSLGYTPTEALDSHIEYTRIDKTGDRPMGMAFGSPGNNAREILEPIDQTTHDLKLTQGFSRERYQFVVSYDLSVFHNGFTSVTSDNPLQATDSPTAGSARGRSALTPDNVAHTLIGSGGLSLPLRTRVTATGSYAWWLQDQQFIPATVNSSITDSRLSSMPRSLGGKAGTSVVNLTADTRPITGLTFSARYRRYDFRDKADVTSLPVEIVNDRSVSGPVDVARDPFVRTTADVGGNWLVFQPISVFAGYNWEQLQLDSPERNIHKYQEKTPRVGLLFTGTDWLSVRTTYSKGWRRNEGYVNGTGYLDGWTRFDVANRDRERLMTVATLTPLDPVSVSATWTIGHDNYPGVQYGVQNDRSGAIGGDVEYAPNERFSIGVGYDQEIYKNRLAARYRTPAILTNTSFDWVANNTDQATVTSANFTAVLVPGKLDAGATFEMSHSRFRLAAYNPTTPTGGSEADRLNATASDFPQITQNLQPLDVFLRYSWTPDWATTVRFQSEMFGQSDFRLVGNKPGDWNMMFLGNEFQNYNAQFLTVTMTFHPGALRGKRSTL